MKKYILPLLVLLLAPCFMLQVLAQNYVVSSLATPGAATFSSDKIVDGVITLPFTATTQTIEVETNQNPIVSSNADWCQASFADGVLTLTATENTSRDTRTAILSVRSKDFHPLLITVKQEARLLFAVISDTHVRNYQYNEPKMKVSRALKCLTASGKLDALAVVGDLTDHGDTDQYTEFVQLFGNSENFNNPVDNFLFMMGNHDNYNTNGQQNYKTGLKSFYLKNGQPTSYPLHRYMLIKGYPFITISVLSGANNDDNSSNGDASYPDETLTTLRTYLQKAAREAPGKPIFVFAHVGPRNTCYSSWGTLEGAAWAMWKLNNSALKNYPQAIVFCGHSHYPIGDPRSIHQGANPKSTNKNYYSVINTGSTTYSEINPGAVDAGIHPEGYTQVTEGMVIEELASGDIEIRRYDTYRNVEIDSLHRWVIKTPFDGSMFQYADIRDANDNPNNVPLRDGLPAPAFTKSAELTVDTYPTDVTIKFPQATDNECVFRYKVRVLKDGNEVKSGFIFSQFYLTKDMPDTLSYTIEGLTGGTEYTAEVIAYDSYDNQSVPLSANFKTTVDDAPVPNPIGWWTFDNPDDLLAGTGVATLQGAIHGAGYAEPVEDLADAAIEAVAGPSESNGAVTVPVGSNLWMNTNINTNQLSTYTWLMDIHVESVSGYNCLFQNDLTNTKDGSLFIYNGTIGKNAGDLGYHGIITSTGWHRIVFAVRDNKAKLYINGTLVSQSSSASELNWKLSTGALFFADENGEELKVNVAEMRFWDKMLTAGQVTKLGTIEGIGEPAEVTIPEALGIWTFDNAANLMSGIGVSTLQPSKHSKGNVSVSTLEDAGITTTNGPSEANGAIFIPKGSSLKMTTNLEATSISSFTFMMDIKLANFSNYMPIFQNDLTNSRDACLFVNKTTGALGIRFGGLGYSDATLTPDKWHRVVAVSKDAKMTVYLDGVKVVGESPEAVPDRWQLGTATLFFADEDGEEMDVKTAEIRFWDAALTADQVAELGEAGSDFVEPQPVDPDVVPEAYSSWTFNDASNPLVETGGTSKATLQPYKKGSDGTMSVTSTHADAGITTANGLAEGDGAVYVPLNSSLLMTPNCNTLSTYSFLMDVKFDDVSGFASIFQNEITNKRDASLFVHDGQLGYATSGLGYNGSINAGQWYRIAVVVKDNRVTVYLDGQKVIQSINANANIWSMKNALAFFADQDEEEQPATISELRFWDKELTAKQVFKLGTAGGSEAQEVVVPDATGAIDFDNPNDRFLDVGTSYIQGWKKGTGGMVVSITGPHADIATVSGPTESNGAVVVPVNYGLILTTNLEADSIDSYTLLMDICLDDVSGYAALFQNDASNKKDGSLFVKDGKVGVNAASLGYHGTINPGQWHRIVFMVNDLIGYVFIDGVKVGRSGAGGETHWKMGQQALFFVDDNGEEKEIKTCEIRFWAGILTEGEIEKLGAVPTE